MRKFANLNVRSLLLRSLVVVGLFAQGMLFGTLSVYWSKGEADVSPTFAIEQTSDGPTISRPLDEPALEQKRLLGERLLLNGEPYQALRHLLQLKRQLGDSSDSFLLFQIATCYEAANDNSAASDLYMQICSRNGSNDSNLIAAAQFALARSAWKAGDTQLALQILWKKIFSTTNQHDTQFYGDIVHMTGQIVAEVSVIDPSIGHLDKTFLQPFPIDFRPERQVAKLVSLQANNRQPVLDTSGKQLSVENLLIVEPVPGSIVMDFSCREASVMQVLQLLSQSTQIDFQMSDRANSSARGHVVSLHASGASMATLLDRVTVPFGLWWEQRDDQILVGVVGEQSDAQRRDGLANVARRLLSKAILEYPEHDALIQSKFDLANIDVRRGEPRIAIVLLSEILEATTDSRIRQCCFFNLSKIYGSMNMLDLSEDAMQKVIDSAAIGDLLTTGFIEIGEIQLANGKLVDAVDTFSRATNVSTNGYLSQIAALNLTCAYLLNDRPGEAQIALLKNSRAFADAELAQMAKYLSALAGFESVAVNQRFNVEGMNAANVNTINLLASLPKVKPVKHLGIHQHLLIARGWAAIGAIAETEAYIELGLSGRHSSFVHDELLFLLASTMIKNYKIDAARTIFASLEYSQAKPKTLQKLFDWAQLEYEMDDTQQSEHLCEELLKFELEESLLASAFRLLGQIHQSRGQHRLATLYFAGFRPE